MKTLYKVALCFVIIGAINWGMVGMFNVNLVSLLFGTDTISVHETWQSPLSKWLEGMYMQGMLSEATMRKICYENAQKIYNLNVKVK